jgi:hypothetical protein
MERLFGAVAGWAWGVVPPAYGPGEIVERVVFVSVAYMLFFVGLVEAEPVVFLAGAGTLLLMRREGGAWSCHG